MAYSLSDTRLQTGAWVRSSGGKPFTTARSRYFQSGNEPQPEPAEPDGKHEPTLALEKPTAEVLDCIYPVKPKEASKKKMPPKHTLKGAANRLSAGCAAIGAFRKKGTEFADSPNITHADAAPAKMSMAEGMRRASKVIGVTGLLQAKQNPLQQQAKDKGRARIMQVRLLLLSKFENLTEAFDELLTGAADGGDANSEISPEIFARIMKRHVPSVDRDDYSAIFDFLDADGGGSISKDEFQMACEVANPVRTLEDLRLKWISLGFTCMQQVVAEMEATTRTRGDNRFNVFRPLNLPEFSAALARVGLVDDDEHMAVFSALAAPNVADHVSVGDLISALAALGPPMLLEDVHHRLLTKYASVQEACSPFTSDSGNPRMTSAEFEKRAEARLGLTAKQAAKMFRMIDIDGTGLISQLDLVRALQIVEVSMFSEIARKKLRQRWRSIQEAFAKHRWEVNTFGIALRPREEADLRALEKARARGVTGLEDTDFKTLTEVQKILATVGMPEKDTETLFKHLDVYGMGRLTASEFVWGMRVCTPSSVMEDMRIHCVSKAASVRQVFENWWYTPEDPEDREDSSTSSRNKESPPRGVFDKTEFRKVAEELGIAGGVNIDLMYDVLEQSGSLRLDTLIVALDTATPGGQVPLKPAQLAEKVRKQVSDYMSPFQNKTKDHRNNVRKRIIDEKDTVPKKLPLGLASEPSGYFCSSSHWQKTNPELSSLINAPRFIKSRSKSGTEGVPSSMKPTGEIQNLNWLSAPVNESSFQEQKLDLSVFTPSLDPCKLPLSRQLQRPLEPPQWAKESHAKMAQLLNPLEYSKEGGVTIMKNLNDYYTISGQTLAVDKKSLSQTATSRYQEFKNMRDAVAAIKK